jgi:hypothetical protein
VEEEGNGMEELESGCIIAGNGKEGEKKRRKGKEEVSALRVYGGTSDVQVRDDKTEVTSLG